MGQIKWYKRDPSAALNGMMELDLQERGAYNTVLDLIYSRDGNLPDDDRFIAGWLRVDVRVWKRIKSTLIDRGKLFIQDGKIRNERADVEVLALAKERARIRQAIPVSVRDFVLNRDGHRCSYCKGASAKLVLDHIVPWSRGRSDEADNLCACCEPCNRLKSDRTPQEMGWQK